MAKVQMKMPDDFLMKVSRLADKTDEILPKVLEAGAEVVEDKVRSNLQAVIKMIILQSRLVFQYFF